MPADLTPTFITYKNYLRSFASLAGFFPNTVDDMQTLQALNLRVRNMPSFTGAAPVACDREAVRKSLVTAWGTELLLALGGVYAGEDELVRLTNNWAAVQLYYILYHATQAVVQAKGSPRPTSHPKTQRLYADLWVTRPLNLAPWTLGVDATAYLNLPTGQVIDPGATPVSWPGNMDMCWSHAAKALRTTRDHAVREALQRGRKDLQSARRAEWTAAEHVRVSLGKPRRRLPVFTLPQVPAIEKVRIRENVRSHTFMDFCYRLRIKTNYEDSRMFIEGPIDSHSSALVHHDLRRLASASLLVYELHLRQILGAAVLQSLIDGWLAGNQASGVLALRQRRDLVLN